LILLTLKVYFNYILCNDSSVLEDSKGSLSHLCLDFPPKEVFNCWNSNLATRLCQFFIDLLVIVPPLAWDHTKSSRKYFLEWAHRFLSDKFNYQKVHSIFVIWVPDREQLTCLHTSKVDARSWVSFQDQVFLSLRIQEFSLSPI
jgi:hypothetical protein